MAPSAVFTLSGYLVEPVQGSGLFSAAGFFSFFIFHFSFWPCPLYARSLRIDAEPL